MARMRILIILVSLLAGRAACDGIEQMRLLGPQGVNLWRLNTATTSNPALAQAPLLVQQSAETYPEALPASEEPQSEPARKFPAHWFTQPLDHFADNASSGHTFQQRYWVSTRHYRPRPDAPVIVLDGGETSGLDRLPFLDTGIVEILTKATGGVGVILEHRYYGRSVPVQNFTTDSLRWLNNAQSAADSANFMANVRFPGVDEDLTAPNHPWIYYGGSYAGARAAHMKVLYPDLVYGAIASSGVTHAALELWEYSDTVRRAADPKCAQNLESSFQVVDALLDVPATRTAIKALFGLAKLKHDDDFASLISSPIGMWQGKVWDPKVGSTGWDEFCEALDKPFRPWNEADTAEYDESVGLVTITDDFAVPLPVYNHARYIKEKYVPLCPGGAFEECFGTHDDSKYQGTDLSQTWRLWMFQVCTEWGYFQTAPPAGTPRIITCRMDLAYESKLCKQAYLPGKEFVVPEFPNVTVVNALGDFDIAADRLAIIDGEVDPWRPATPHSQYAHDRPDTILQPFKLIPNAVHHYDEYGLPKLSDEPLEIQLIHEEMIGFVVSWLSDWEAPSSPSH
ncbi:peptidase S28 [Lenzites betulinus]|nr:peptidase S28 [Lenzites betulinus]